MKNIDTEYREYIEKLQQQIAKLKENYIKVEYPEHGMVILTNAKGDTYTSKSEELIDFVSPLNKH